MKIMRKNRDNFLMPLLLFTVLGILMRLYELSANSFWTDELLSIWHARDIKDIITFLTPLQNNAHPPFYFLLLKAWSIGGHNEFYLRLLSAICGVLAIPSAYLLGRQFLNKETSLLTSFMIAISPLYLLYDREVRMYSLFTLLTILSLYFFIRALREDKIKLWIGYTIFTVLGTYTHYHTFLIIMAEWIFFIIRLRYYKDIIKKAFITQLIIAIIFSFWLPAFLYHLKQFSVLGAETTRFPVTIGAWIKPLYLFYCYSIGQTVLPWKLYVAIPAAIIFAIAFIYGARDLLKNKENMQFFSVFLFVPIFVGMVISDLVPRYFLFLMPIYLLIITNGIFSFRRPVYKTISIVLISIILIYPIKNYFNGEEFHNMANIDPWREVGVYLKEEVNKNDVVYNIGGIPINYYTGLQIPVLGANAVQYISSTFNNADEKENERIWVILSNPIYKKEGAAALTWLRGHAEQISEKKYLYDPEYEKKAKYFNKDFYEYRIAIYLFERSKKPV